MYIVINMQLLNKDDLVRLDATDLLDHQFFSRTNWSYVENCVYRVPEELRAMASIKAGEMLIELDSLMRTGI